MGTHPIFESDFDCLTGSALIIRSQSVPILLLLVVIWVQNTVAGMVDVTMVAAEGADDLALDHVIDIHADLRLHTAADPHPLIPPAAPDPDESFLNCHFRSKTLSPHMQIPLLTVF